jgi:hypothetical protein
MWYAYVLLLGIGMKSVRRAIYIEAIECFQPSTERNLAKPFQR